MKVVINKCFGGFNLSYKAMMRYAELKGIKLYAFKDVINGKDIRHEPWDGKEDALFCHYSTSPDPGKINDCYFSGHDIDRDDPLLVQVVEEMGDEASGRYAALEIVEVPDDIEWHVEEYHGNEHIAEDHRTWY
jgi:hypothetical protein